MRLAVLQGLFLIYLLVLSLIFSDSGIWGHFRGARSGVYMVSRRTDSVIRFGFLVEWMDAHFRYYSTAPPDCSLTRQSETAGRDLVVWDLVFDRLAYKKPEAPMPCSSFGCRLTHRRSGGLPSDCSFGLRPRRTRLFCLTAR